MPRLTVDCTVYAHVEPKFGSVWDSDDQCSVEGVRSAKVVAINQMKTPARKGCVVVKLTIRFPMRVFMPLQPEAVVVIPDSFTGLDLIEVEAIDPTDMNEAQVAEYLASQARREP